MSPTPSTDKTTAPLRNVSLFATLVKRVINRGPDEPGLACFYGLSGYGKTKSATLGANSGTASYIEVGQYTTARSMMKDILQELGEHHPAALSGSVDDMKRRAIAIMSRDPSRPLIIDETHFIAAKKFVDLPRELSDKSNAPVIFIGEEGLLRSLEQFERVHNRLFDIIEAVPSDLQDARYLARTFAPDVTIGDDLLEYLVQALRGNARRIVVNLARVREEARRTGRHEIGLTNITQQLITTAGVPRVLAARRRDA